MKTKYDAHVFVNMLNNGCKITQIAQATGANTMTIRVALGKMGLWKSSRAVTILRASHDAIMAEMEQKSHVENTGPGDAPSMTVFDNIEKRPHEHYPSIRFLNEEYTWDAVGSNPMIGREIDGEGVGLFCRNNSNTDWFYEPQSEDGYGSIDAVQVSDEWSDFLDRLVDELLPMVDPDVLIAWPPAVETTQTA